MEGSAEQPGAGFREAINRAGVDSVAGQCGTSSFLPRGGGPSPVAHNARTEPHGG